VYTLYPVTDLSIHGTGSFLSS